MNWRVRVAVFHRDGVEVLTVRDREGMVAFAERIRDEMGQRTAPTAVVDTTGPGAAVLDWLCEQGCEVVVARPSAARLRRRTWTLDALDAEIRRLEGEVRKADAERPGDSGNVVINVDGRRIFEQAMALTRLTCPLRECSGCGREISVKFDYCPRCGTAKLPDLGGPAGEN